ncbi:unnamed protein product [Rangifer tarandus platyrhynchus]|uniref:Uncharacterized protein n=2 Tax=Rangifer tarandus platyrhynchus TaxID=3082113 RepID=A0ABN8ZQ10_RANTA|nr:unnamed protein product [Rangifer tarandus platyrhynchus]CAI9709772.1 unnamed protein product [Rangifer tarandus platyrhynchus]
MLSADGAEPQGASGSDSSQHKRQPGAKKGFGEGDRGGQFNISLTFKGSDSGSQGAATWRTGSIAFPEVNLGALGRTTDHRDSVVWDACGWQPLRRLLFPATLERARAQERPVRRLRCRAHRHLVVFRHAGRSDLSR